MAAQSRLEGRQGEEFWFTGGGPLLVECRVDPEHPEAPGWAPSPKGTKSKIVTQDSQTPQDIGQAPIFLKNIQSQSGFPAG